ncbi:recombination protein RecR [Bdellovibrio bacteriovorus]|uniref:Recombination protein RecR n=1 Tax=Bdellovibrio bacteriovorus TaxID=959 RepID=A0A150WVZ4_BDEBC|nr:recombination mediator RecR [Bdellovibrio bacteriovorus]KYG68787.1 recombination protein RecR [Bdellovibrio bacteriovorus]KYG70680.1 recombination protein RecR [Bdellovibrio bacteriovorus]
MLHIGALEKLVHELSRLPGIGPKTAQRLAYFILKTNNDFPERLSEALLRVKAEVHECPRCFNYTDTDLCRFCEDPHRSDESICVVEEPADIVRIESSGAFRGRYHVLHGAISPLEGIGPQDLKIKELVERVEAGLSGQGPVIKEIILALDADLEGDTTILYLAKHLQGKGLKLSRIAHGVPIGSDIDFIDDRTMGRALQNRVEL